MGKPHEICVRDTFAGLSEEQLAFLVNDTLTEDNLMVRKHGGDLYDGVANGLEQLSRQYRLFIVSNCQAGYIETFVELNGLEGLFVDFECWGNTGNSKAENLAKLIERNSLTRPVMVGDMESDRAGATHCGIPFIHAAYGFGEIIDCDLRIDSFNELTEILQKGYSAP